MVECCTTGTGFAGEMTLRIHGIYRDPMIREALKQELKDLIEQYLEDAELKEENAPIWT